MTRVRLEFTSTTSSPSLLRPNPSVLEPKTMNPRGGSTVPSGMRNLLVVRSSLSHAPERSLGSLLGLYNSNESSSGGSVWVRISFMIKLLVGWLVQGSRRTGEAAVGVIARQG